MPHEAGGGSAIIALLFALLFQLPGGLNALAKDIRPVDFVKNGVVYRTDDGRSCMVYSFTDKLPADLSIPSTVSYGGKTIPVELIVGHAFLGCPALRSLRIGGGVKKINWGAFASCPRLAKVIFEEGCEKVGCGAFVDCQSLKEVVIPQSVKQISASAFANCTSLTDVKLAANPERAIHWSAFAGCEQMAGQFPNNTPKWFRQGKWDCVVAADGGGVVVGLTPGEYAAGSVTIPAQLGGYSVVGLADWAFTSSDELTNVNLPASLLSIGESAFGSCSSLTTLRLPEGLRSIGEGVFSDCDELRVVVLPKTLTSIGEEAFIDCSKLQGIKIPSGVKEIAGYTFFNCTSLASVELPESVTLIDTAAFYNCVSLRKLKLPRGLLRIGEDAFGQCAGVVGFSLPDGNPEVGEGAIGGFGLNLSTVEVGQGTVLDDWFGPEDTHLTTIRIGANVTTLDSHAFRGGPQVAKFTVDPANSNFKAIDGVLYSIDGKQLVAVPPSRTGVFTVPNGVSSTASGAFGKCTKLTAVVLPASLTSLGFMTSDGCALLSSITLSNQMQVPERYTEFNDCPKLKKVVVKGGDEAAWSAALPEGVQVVVH